MDPLGERTGERRLMREGEVLFLNSLMAEDWQGEVCGSRKFELLNTF